MFTKKQTSPLSQRLAEADPFDVRKTEEKTLDRDTLFKSLLPHAQKRIQEKFTAAELADRHAPAVRQKVKKAVSEVVEEQAPQLLKPAIVSLVEDLVDDLLGYGPLEPFFTGPEAHMITEIIVGRWDRIIVEKEGKRFPAVDGRGQPVKFRNEQHVLDVLERMLAPTGRRIDIASPRVSARLPDGSRLMAHISSVAVGGATITIRRFRQDMTADKLLENKSLSKETMEFLIACVKARLNIFVSGGTGSGKTALLNILSYFIPAYESVVTIEDPAELQLQNDDVRRLEARSANVEGKGEITQSDLMADALRMAPNRIIVGESRREEAFSVLQAMNTGHDGSMSTGHANSADEMLNSRLPNMVSMLKNPPPREAVVSMIASAVDLVLHLTRDRSGRRRVDHIVETVGIEVRKTGPVVATRPIYVYDEEKDDWVRTEHIFTRQHKLEGLPA